MPELPDVETFKKYLQKKALKQKIAHAEVLNPKVLSHITQKQLEKALKGKQFQAAKRYGKYLFVEISEDLFLVLHFGMTGFLYYFQNKNPFQNHSRVLFTFENGACLAFVDMRMLGRVALSPSINAFIKQKNLGPDALEISYKDFSHLFEGKLRALKAVLMDQSLIAGLGNVYCDEIFFQARLIPDHPTSTLTSAQIKTLYQKMQDVLKKATDANGDPEKMPRTWLLLHRKKGEKCPNCGQAIEKMTLGGRSTYFCFRCQK